MKNQMSQIHISLSSELHRRIIERAKEAGRSMNAEVCKILEDSINIQVVGIIGDDGRITMTNRTAKWTDKLDPEFIKYQTGQDILDPRD